MQYLSFGNNAKYLYIHFIPYYEEYKNAWITYNLNFKLIKYLLKEANIFSGCNTWFYVTFRSVINKY